MYIKEAGVERPLLLALALVPVQSPTAAAAAALKDAAATESEADSEKDAAEPLHSLWLADAGRLLRTLDGSVSTSEAEVDTVLKKEFCLDSSLDVGVQAPGAADADTDAAGISLGLCAATGPWAAQADAARGVRGLQRGAAGNILGFSGARGGKVSATELVASMADSTKFDGATELLLLPPASCNDEIAASGVEGRLGPVPTITEAAAPAAA